MNLKIAKQNLLDIKKVLDDLKVEFWIDAGTLLGVIRGGDLIEWDYDIDIGMKAQYVDDLIFKKLSSEQGFILIENRVINNKTMMYKINKNGINCCLDFYYFRENYAYTGKKRIAIVLPKFLFENLKWITFLDKKFLVPNPPEIYLEERYGDWRTPTKETDFRKFTKGIKYDWPI